MEAREPDSDREVVTGKKKRNRDAQKEKSVHLHLPVFKIAH